MKIIVSYGVQDDIMFHVVVLDICKNAYTYFDLCLN